MRNAELDEHKLESRLPGEINNLRYADDTTLMVESEEELKSLLIKVKEESEKVGLITSPGWMHEASAQAWCTGKTQRNRVEREVGGGIGIGNTCNSMVDSCQCMTKPTEML